MFKTSAMSHLYIHGVCFTSHYIMSQSYIHLFIPLILCCPFWPPVILSPIRSGVKSLVATCQACTLFSHKGSRMFVPRSHIFHYPSCQSIRHIIIFARALVEDPHCPTYGGPYSLDINTFIPEERPRGKCILVPSSILLQFLRSRKGTRYYPLTWFFHALDSYT